MNPQIDLATLDLTQLKALGYEKMGQLQHVQQEIAMINQVIAVKQSQKPQDVVVPETTENIAYPPKTTTKPTIAGETKAIEDKMKNSDVGRKK